MTSRKESQMSNKIFIGIDYSLISPSICIIKNDKYNWISIYTANVEDHHKILNKENSSFKILNESKLVNINILDKHDKQGETYSHTERNKLITSIKDIDFIISTIKKYIEPDCSNIYVAIEGISFGAKGNVLIDISMSTGILRSKIITEILHNNIDNFYVYSPGTIKKFAGKGTFKKNDMYNALISNNDLSDLEFIKLLKFNKDNWITPAGAVKKPLDDIIDSTWIALLLKSEVCLLKK